MTSVKILLSVKIENNDDWLGLEDYKKYHGATSDLEALKLMTEMEGTTPLNLLVNLCDNSNPSEFVSVETDEPNE